MAFLATSWPLWLCLVLYFGILQVAIAYANKDQPVFSKTAYRLVWAKYIISLILLLVGIMLSSLGYGAA